MHFGHSTVRNAKTNPDRAKLRPNSKRKIERFKFSPATPFKERVTNASPIAGRLIKKR